MIYIEIQNNIKDFLVNQDDFKRGFVIENIKDNETIQNIFNKYAVRNIYNIFKHMNKEQTIINIYKNKNKI